MNTFLIVKCMHVCFVMMWMAGMFALPWFYIIHLKFVSHESLRHHFNHFEHWFLRGFIDPCLIFSFITGCYLVWHMGGWSLFDEKWFQVKAILLFMMFLTHGLMARFRKVFIYGGKPQTESTYFNSAVLTMLIMLLINIVVMLKPF